MAITFSNIGLAEPSTITNRVGAVTISRGSTAEQQEILVIGDPSDTIGMVLVLASTPASTEYGLAVREIAQSTGPFAISSIAGVSVVSPNAGSTWSVRPLQSSAADLQMTATPVAGSTWATRPLQSSAADLQMTATPVAGSTWNVRPLQSSQADLRVTVYQSSAAELLATVTPTTGSTWSVRPLQSSAADLQMTATPVAGSTWNVRPLQSSQADLRVTVYQSSAAELLATVTPTAGSTWSVRPLQSSAADLQMTATIGANLQSTVAGAAGSSGLLVREIYPSLLSTRRVITSSNSTALYSLVSSAAGVKQKVYAYSLTSTETTPSTLVFMTSNAGDRWAISFGSGSSGISGANLAIAPPASIFQTNAAESLQCLIEKGASTRCDVTLSIAYFTEA